MRILYSDGHKIACVSWSPDGKLLAAGMTDGVAYLWNVEADSNEPLIKLNAHSGSVNALVWRPDGQSLITTGQDGKIRLWEPRTGKLKGTLEGHIKPVTCLAPSPNWKILASGSLDGTIRLWDVEGGWTFNLLRDEPNDTKVRKSSFTALAWSPVDTLLASGDSTGNIHIWDTDSRKLKRFFQANCGSIISLAWSPDGRILICGGDDGTARAWDVKNDFQEYLVLLPLWGSAGPGIAISREGDYRGPPGIADHLVYIVSTERGQETLTPADFKSRFGWVNEPWQVGLFSPGLEQVQRIYVKADAKPPYDGNSWDSAFNDLQDALKMAQPNTEIWVAAGVYKPDRGTGAREASFYLKNGVRLFGGFSGTETSIAHRDPNRNETILSGDLKGDDAPDFVNYDDNSYHVITSIYTEPNAVIDGFVVFGGNADGPAEGEHRHGGGMYNANGRPTVMNCIFRYNSAIWLGGGMFNSYGGQMGQTLTDCSFIGNRVIGQAPSGGGGGGMSNLGSTRPTLINCIFRANSSGDCGGGLHMQSDYTILINCTFINNSAVSAGAVYVSGTSSFNNCIFIGNSSKSYGGALYNGSKSTPTLYNCTFLNNSAKVHGGAISNEGSLTNLINCRFLGNSADNEWGGTIHIYNSSVLLVNCLFSGNSAEQVGGGIASEHGSNATVANCTFNRNAAGRIASGIFQDDKSSLTLINCILWGNTDTANDIEVGQIQGGKIEAKNCCIQGWTGKLGGTGNFAMNPLFVDPNGPDNKVGTADDNLRLDLASPCRDVGDNSVLPADVADLDNDGDVNEPIPFDIDGKPRILNGAIDLGAYESG